jgi:hypothetical protein
MLNLFQHLEKSIDYETPEIEDPEFNPGHGSE